MEYKLPEIVQDLLDEKGKVDDQIDLNVYGNGLLDMYNEIVKRLNKEIIQIDNMLN